MILEETHERQKLYRFAGKVLASRGAETVLDAACGNGEGTRILVEEIQGEIVGLDRDANFIERAEEKKSPRARFVVGDVRKMDFRDSSFDAAVSFHTIEHLNGDDQKQFLGEFLRVLKPHSWFILGTPDRDVWELQGIAGTQPDHIKELTRNEVEDVMTLAGFKILEVYGQELVRSGNFTLRRILNILKKLDVLKIRRFLGEKTLGKIDQGTQPVDLKGDVLLLTPGLRASINIFISRKR